MSLGTKVAELLAVCYVSPELIGVPELDFWTVFVMLELQQLNFHSPVLNLRFYICYLPRTDALLQYI